MQKKESNIIIRQDLIIYNALKLYNDDTLFRMPSYLVNEVVDYNRKLVLKHNDEILRSYTGQELIKAISTVDKKPIKGMIKGKPIEFNITVFKI